MRTDFIHYTTIGLAIQPPEADPEGFLAIRSGFENFPNNELSRSERVVRDQVKRIEEWRDADAARVKTTYEHIPGAPYRAHEELYALNIEKCIECNCIVDRSWEYDDFSSKSIITCSQCGEKYYLTSLWEDREGDDGKDNS